MAWSAMHPQPDVSSWHPERTPARVFSPQWRLGSSAALDARVGFVYQWQAGVGVVCSSGLGTVRWSRLAALVLLALPACSRSPSEASRTERQDRAAASDESPAPAAFKAGALEPQAPRGVGTVDAGTGGVLILSVSNQSSATPNVDIQVSIDDRYVIDGVFSFEGGHTRKSYEFALAKGTHVVRVVGDRGSARYEGIIDVQRRHWAMLFYWYEPGALGQPDLEPRHITFDMRDKPVPMR